ncbi:MAG TPA: ATP-binding protein [Herpetosiphonaceae bacterium]
MDQFVTPIELNRDTFMRRLIASLGHLNEGILGTEVAGAYIMNVGLSMGAAIEAEYKAFWGIDRPFTLDEYAHVIIDLKQKIHGNFSLVSADPTKVVVRTTSCPFDEVVRQSPSLCFMTSSVFGGIAARNFGYAKVVLHKRIALGDPGCYVAVHLQNTPEAQAVIGREYTPATDQASPDIAEQLRLMDSVRRLRRQLDETSSRWDELVHGAAEAICVFDLDQRVSFANARWRDMLGVEGAELVGATLEQLVHADKREEVHGYVHAALHGQRVVGQAQRLLHRNGTWREIVISLGPIRDETGRIIGALGLFYDVTEEREAQRLKDAFLATASHELRTPVTTIRGLTEFLLRRVKRQGAIDPADLIRHLETIQQETDRLAALGTELLDVALLQQGVLSMQIERSDLVEIVAACVAQQRGQAGPDQPERFILLQPDSEVPVNVARPRIERVLSDLLENAVKYSPANHPITITTTAEEDHVHVQIADQGIGIPQQDVPKLFTPFFRASNAPELNYSGLGLGLYFSKAVVEAHGGQVMIQSVEGQGTTCTLSLPLAMELQAAPDAPQQHDVASTE